jgi:hypothetical protein
MGGASSDRGRPDAGDAEDVILLEAFAVSVLVATAVALTYWALVRSGDMG